MNQTIRKPEGMGLAALHLGWLARQQEDDGQALAWFCESLRHYRNTGAVSRIANCLEGIAAILTADGQPQEAARCFGMAAALRSSRRAFYLPQDRPRYERDLAAARASLSGAAFEAAWHAGNAVSPAESIAEALAISITGPRRRPTGELARQVDSA